MKIKRTFGATMREALAQVKLEQGPDAVILGNKKVPGGVEILSALDFDQSSLEKYTERNDNRARVVQGQTSARASSGASDKADAMRDLVPDFILNQSLEGRREPVLGLGRAASQVTQQTRAPVSQATRPARPPADNQVRQRTAATAAPARESVRRPEKQAKAPPAPRRQSALPVEKEVEKRYTQADQLLNSLRENEYQRQQVPLDSRPVIEEVKEELKNLRDLMKSQLNVLEWDKFSQRHPVRSVLLSLMTEMGLGADVSELVFGHLGQLNEDPHKVWQQALGILATAIPISSVDILSTGGRVALVGSTGVGKTTTIAKLAARFAHLHGKQSVALVTTDNFRIGAHEQLQHFARMLEVPLLNANNSDELTDRLKMLADKRLVLIDTAGMSQNDVRLSEQFHKLQHGSPEIQPYLVLSANTQLPALSETIRNFSKVRLNGAIVTKLDESASLGGVITAAIRHQLPLAYCGTGQRVPEDLHQAKNHRLVSRAVSLMQKYAEDFDKESLAFRYNHLISQHKGG